MKHICASVGRKAPRSASEEFAMEVDKAFHQLFVDVHVVEVLQSYGEHSKFVPEASRGLQRAAVGVQSVEG